ncbi:MAG: hypothetical protein WCQ53_01725 [bacterium]
MKTLIFSLFIFVLPAIALGDDDYSFKGYKEDVGYNMSLSADLIQLDPTCPKKAFYPTFGTAYNWLNSDQSTSTVNSLFKTQVK